MHTSGKKSLSPRRQGGGLTELDGRAHIQLERRRRFVRIVFLVHFVLFPTCFLPVRRRFSTQIVLNEDRKEGTQSHVICMGRGSLAQPLCCNYQCQTQFGSSFCRSARFLCHVRAFLQATAHLVLTVVSGFPADQETANLAEFESKPCLRGG